jgi:hypothetical protein
MATWNVYIEFEGYPLNVDIELDDEDYQTEDEVWDYINQNIMFEATKESN